MASRVDRLGKQLSLEELVLEAEAWTVKQEVLDSLLDILTSKGSSTGRD